MHLEDHPGLLSNKRREDAKSMHEPKSPIKSQITFPNDTYPHVYIYIIITIITIIIYIYMYIYILCIIYIYICQLVSIGSSRISKIVEMIQIDKLMIGDLLNTIDGARM
jgi:hypothetical protein